MKKLINQRSFMCDCGCEASHNLGGVYIKQGFGYQIETLTQNGQTVTPIIEDFYTGEVILDLPNTSSNYLVENKEERSTITNGLFVAIAEDDNNNMYFIYAVNESKEINPHMNKPHQLYLIPVKNYRDYINSGGTVTGIYLGG